MFHPYCASMSFYHVYIFHVVFYCSVCILTKNNNSFNCSYFSYAGNNFLCGWFWCMWYNICAWFTEVYFCCLFEEVCLIMCVYLFQVVFASLTTYVLVNSHNLLTSKKIFVSIALLNILRMPLGLTPIIVAFTVQVKHHGIVLQCDSGWERAQ